MLSTPYWFGQRQLKAEAAGAFEYRVTGPNAPERFLGIRQADNGKYLAFLRFQQDGPEETATRPEFGTVYDAWEAAFELYRQHEIV